MKWRILKRSSGLRVLPEAGSCCRSGVCVFIMLGNFFIMVAVLSASNERTQFGVST